MKIWRYFLFYYFLSFYTSEAQTSENFNDGNFTTPLWDGDTTLFQINASSQLQSKGIAGVAGESAIATKNFNIKNTEWTFWLRFNLSPSSSNFCRFYLSSDQADLKGSLNGYFIQFGGSTGATDSISLFKQTGISKKRIIVGRPGTVAKTNNIVKIKVSHEPDGTWKLYSDTSSAQNYILEGNIIDSTFNTSLYTGLYCKYTSSNTQNFYFDDLIIKEIGIDTVISTPILAAYKNIVITEILADPSPREDLPEKEYIEIFNTSSQSYDLTGYTLSDPGTTATISATSIPANSYIILCSVSDVPDFVPYGKVKGLSNFPTLNNAGDIITLKDPNGKIIDKVSYSIDWYRNENKKDGGWSLELVNPYSPCISALNWKPSVSLTGGTPGKINSVFDNSPDEKAPELLSIDVVDTNCIKFIFNEMMDSLALVNGGYFINNGAFKTSVKAIYDEQKSLELYTIPALANGKENSIKISGLKDCSGNSFISDHTFNFILPEQSDSLDVIINEVLFNPKPNGVDFVEIYNRSEKYIDLKNWEITNFDKGAIANNKIISSESFIIPPYKYIVLTTDAGLLKSQYSVDAEACISLTSMPSMNDDKGTIILLNNKHSIIDRFDYSEDYHYSLLDNKEGVSLERISSTVNTNSKDNWHSASSISGYASPGYKNSQQHEDVKSPVISIDPKVITPDEDGYKDFALINYKFNQYGNMANVTIFDKQGREVRKLIKNALLGTEGFFQWDGVNDDKSKAAIGPYIIYIEIFHVNGEVKNYKETVVVAIK